MKSRNCKRLIALALAAVLCLSLSLSFKESVPVASAVTENQKNIVNRADYLYGITWVAQKTVSAHAYSYYYTYYAGNTYHLPYGQGSTSYYIGYGVTPEYFIQAAADPNSEFYAYKSYAGSWYSTYYITDCSGFVSWCWGLTAKQSTRSLASYSTYIGAVNTSNIINYLQVGDALNRYDYHVVLVTDLIYNSAGNLTGIEITEQTIPETKRTIYTPSQLASAYASYDGIYRYYGNVPSSPVVEKEETWIEKACFDVMVYRDRNKDLAGMTDAELKAHWLSKGIKEGRASSVVLDLGFYRNNNPDLIEAFGTDYEKIYNHFITSGYKEYRKSSALFDGSYYTNKYSDVASNYKELYLLHYIDHGMAEGRRASLTFDPDYYWYILPDVYEAWPDDYSMCAKHYAGHGINAQIEAYDHEHPVVSDVKVTDITAEGYTITCTVTDNWGISKVSFPTWTVNNGQDDLPEQFMNTQLGTCNGNTFTFYVKASDHNNEIGEYATHIYAVDKGGNTTHFAMDVVDVKDPVITLESASNYTMDETYVYGVVEGTTVSSLLTRFTNSGLEVVDCSGNVITGTAIVGTGAQLNLYQNGSVVDSVTVVVLGDADGNGIVDVTDYQRVKALMLGKLTLNAAQCKAADIDGSGIVDRTDSQKIKEYFLGTVNFYE